MMPNRSIIVFLLLFLLFSGHFLVAGNYDFMVAQDGSGNFTTIQKAIDACKAFPDSRITIFVKNGTYKEKIVVPSCNNLLSVIGESAEKTIILFDDFFDKINRGRNSTFCTYTLKVEANDFILQNITVFDNSGSGGDLSKKVGWSLELNKQETLNYCKENIFASLGWEIPQENKWYEFDVK